mgnify:CR=1 FL=1
MSSDQQNPEVKKEIPTPVVVQEQQSDFFINKLNEMSNQITFANYNKLISVREYVTEDGTKYTARLLKPKEIGQLRQLVTQVEKIDKEVEWEKYLENMEKQAELLIKDFNQEKFDNCDFYLLENLIVAWRMTYRGFRNL